MCNIEPKLKSLGNLCTFNQFGKLTLFKHF